MAGVFESLYNAYAGTLASVTNTYVGQWTPIATTAFAASGALYFTLLGFLVFRGAVARPLQEVAVSATKFALMCAVLGSLGFVGQAVTTLNGLGPALAGSSTGSNAGQAMDTYFAGVWKLQEAANAKETAAASGTNADGTSGSSSGGIIGALTGVDMDQAVQKVEDFLALVVAVICAAISAAIGFCVLFFAQIALDIVLCFAPIAIACVFWPQTRWFFQGWLSQAINYVILYIVLIIMTKMITDAATSTVTAFLGTSDQIMAGSVVAGPDGAVATVLQEAIEVMLVYLVGTFLFFQAPTIASGLAGGAASGGHTFLAMAANQAMGRFGGGGGAARAAGSAAARGGSSRGDDIMRRHARSVVLLSLASAALSGCGPHLKKLGVCSSGPYRYANPKGVSLPSLSVPTPEDLNSPPPSMPDAGAAPNGTPPPPPPPSTSAPAPSGAQPATPSPSDSVPVATPPKTGAMVLPRGSTTFGSC